MKISQIIYRIWLAVLAILVVVCSLEQSPVLIGGTVQTTCFAMLGMLVLLGVWLLIPGAGIEDGELKKVFAVKNPPKGEAAVGDVWRGKLAADGAQRGAAAAADAQNSGIATAAHAQGRLPAALRQTAAFMLAAVLYWCYCFRMDSLLSTNSKMDALVAGGLICAAVLLGRSGLGQRDLRGQGL
ncbi:MAG: hypothetical protein LUG93_11960 [Lachnospiraceae bacterium]|nr:hypothetical protein [Lachnospiraceae bacterium]